MSAPCQNICTPWCSLDDLPVDCQTLPDAEKWIDVASNLMFRLSGAQFAGTCIDVVRPCARWDNRGLVSNEALSGLGYNLDGTPYTGYQSGWGACGCNRGRRCGCSSVPELSLGGFPVVAVDEVLIDGAVLAPRFYRVDDFRYLVRLRDDDGTNPAWPCCQQVTLDATELGTWQVTYRYGTLPDAAGVAACALWACELAKAANGDACNLPAKVRTVTSQEVTVEVAQPEDFLDKGRTGIPLVDMWLRAVNPAGISARSRVVDPGIGRRVRRVTTPHG